LLLEGEAKEKVWILTPDAEVKVAGWWGRLDQLRTGDRVWVWFKDDRSKKPVAVCMVADELSEQDMHGPGVTVQARGKSDLTLKPTRGSNRVLQTGQAEVYRGQTKLTVDDLQVGEKVYVQSAGGQARLVLDPAAFEARRAAQKAALRKRWAEE